MMTMGLWEKYEYYCQSAKYQMHSRAQFHRAAKHENLLSMNFFRNKNRITNQISICCILLVTSIQLLFGYPDNYMEI